jgi:hypothetical protein
MLSFLIHDVDPVRVTAPRRGTLKSAGYDLFFPVDVQLPAKAKKKVEMRVQVFLPENYYGQLALRSSIAVRHDLLLLGGVIGNSLSLFSGKSLNRFFSHFPSRPRLRGQNFRNFAEPRGARSVAAGWRVLRTIDSGPLLLSDRKRTRSSRRKGGEGFWVNDIYALKQLSG